MNELVAFYKENAEILRSAFTELGFSVYGGTNAPYVWVGFPGQARPRHFCIIYCPPGCLANSANSVAAPIRSFLDFLQRPDAVPCRTRDIMSLTCSVCHVTHQHVALAWIGGFGFSPWCMSQ